MIRTRYQASAIFLVDGKHRAESIASSGPGALDLRKMLQSSASCVAGRPNTNQL